MTAELQGDAGQLYLSSAERIQRLVLNAAPEATETLVCACPGWRIRDVVAHLVGVIEDAAAGRLNGPPTEALTADQVERHESVPITELIQRWNSLATPFAEALTRHEIWSAMLDVVADEHDIRTALRQPGERDCEAVTLGANRLAASVGPPVTILVDGEHPNPTMEGASGSADSGWVVRASAFEVFRFRLGRRSIDQVRALDWSKDPSQILHQLFVFGPASSPLLE